MLHVVPYAPEERGNLHDEAQQHHGQPDQEVQEGHGISFCMSSAAGVCGRPARHRSSAHTVAQA